MSNIDYKTIDIKYEDTLCVNFLYKTTLGRCFLKILTIPKISKFFGLLMDLGISEIFISYFVKKNNIDLSEYKKINYKSFNDFFKREIKIEKRPIPLDENCIFAPCDGKLTAYKINENSFFNIKNSIYNIETLLNDKSLSNEFANGNILIFRLTPDNYHRYHFIDDGVFIFSKKIDGVLHTVKPIALENYKIYSQNQREYSILKTKNFGKIIQMEVGALFVGKIKNHSLETFKRGQEKGMFEFGGSTVIMIFNKDVKIFDEFFENTKNNKETLIKMGEPIGSKLY